MDSVPMTIKSWPLCLLLYFTQLERHGAKVPLAQLRFSPVPPVFFFLFLNLLPQKAKRMICKHRLANLVPVATWDGKTMPETQLSLITRSSEKATTLPPGAHWDRTDDNLPEPATKGNTKIINWEVAVSAYFILCCSRLTARCALPCRVKPNKQ